MADSNFVLSRGYDAAAAITKHRAVKFTTAESTVTPVTARTDVVAGVSEFDVTAADILKGKGASVAHMGIVTMEAAAAITVGQLIAPTVNGRADVAASTDRVIGVCVGYPAAGAGERISVLLGLPGNILV